MEDVTARDALIALQGPSSFLILQTFVDFDLKKLALYHIRRTTIMGEKTWLARTGYTGERGYEIWMPGPKAAELWDSLMEAGEFNGLVPAGLSARDLLRLEMGFPLYGHELNERTTPVEAGLLRGVSFKKGEFVGRSALEAQTGGGAEPCAGRLRDAFRGAGNPARRVLDSLERIDDRRGDVGEHFSHAPEADRHGVRGGEILEAGDGGLDRHPRQGRPREHRDDAVL